MKGVPIMDDHQAAIELVAMNRDLIGQIRHTDSLTDKYRLLLQFSCRVSNVAAIQNRASLNLFKKAETLIAVACSALENAGEGALAQKLRSDLRDAMDEALIENGSEGTKH